MLVNIFDDESIKVATPEFARKLIDALPFIVEESTVNALISILVVLLPHFEKTCPNDNLVLSEFISKKEDFYKEKLIYLTNRGSMYRLDKCMQTIAVLLTN